MGGELDRRCHGSAELSGPHVNGTPDSVESPAANIRSTVTIDIGKSYGAVIDELVPATGVIKLLWYR
jgi:hypothetical protein